MMLTKRSLKTVDLSNAKNAFGNCVLQNGVLFFTLIRHIWKFE